MPPWFPAVASSVLAVIPVFIWIGLISRKGENKSLYLKTFIIGTLAVIPPLIINAVFSRYPQFNVYSIIGRTIEQVALNALLTNIVVGVIEEIAKNTMVRVVDKRHPEYIQTIGSALRLSICAGLGFSFAENIFYFYNIWTSPLYGASDLFVTFIFRSMFTMLGHMVFSGIFGYYFGIGKFAADITEYARWEGQSLIFARLLSKITGRMTFQIMRELKNLKGLFIAMTLHALFNASLDLQYRLPSILIVTLSALYIMYLLHTKSGHLLFSVIKRRRSTMAPRDQDVVMELLGIWAKERKYKEIIEICDRLLQRDPDNNVVKMFKAKAADNVQLKQVYTALKGVFEKAEEAEQTGQQAIKTVVLNTEDEKVVLEVMEVWYREGNYKQVLDIANRLLKKNPNSQGAKVLLDKSMDKEKLKAVFDSLTKLFKE